MQPILFLSTMDAEPARIDIPEDVRSISVSGPESWDQSERAIEGYLDACTRYGLPVTIFAHPEVTEHHANVLRQVDGAGGCLGLHIHPYKLDSCGGEYGDRFFEDLGAYDAEIQRTMISVAADRWEQAIGYRPRYFRGGFFSANDMTMTVLDDLGFVAGGLSIPGRVLASHQSVWSGAPDHPHRGHRSFRLCEGDLDYVEVPVSVDYERPVMCGAAGEVGYEWPYLPAGYDHRELTRNIIYRLSRQDSGLPVFMIDVHNDQDFSDRQSPSARNLRSIMEALEHTCDRLRAEWEPTVLSAIPARLEELTL